MNKQQEPEAAETVQTTSVPAVDLPQLVQLLPCPFCGSEAEITDESQPNRPKSWFFAWCKNRPECNCWLADGSPEKVAKIWNRREGGEEHVKLANRCEKLERQRNAAWQTLKEIRQLFVDDESFGATVEALFEKPLVEAEAEIARLQSLLNDERMHHYQRRRASITGLVL